MIDTHAHLDNAQFDNDRAEVLERAFASGVSDVIIPSIEPKNFDAVRALADNNPHIWRGIGVHPHHAHQATIADLARVEREATAARVVAIGEIGLDYYYDFAPKEVQQIIFREQLKIAKITDRPVIVHNRESDDDILRIIEEEQDGTLRGVLHCFSGNPAMLAAVIRLGLCVSFTGNITYKKSTLGETVAVAPLDKIMIETDAPYMTPVPYRGKRNEPSFVRFIAEKIAELHSVTIETVTTMTTATAKNLFRLSAVFLFFVATITPLFAQNSSNPRDEEYEEEEEEEVIEQNPYPKFIGFAPALGLNTIIELHECASGRRNSVSYDGIISFGGSINYGLFDFLTLDASYLYSKNNSVKITEFYSAGNLHQFINLGARFIANPRKRISFFAVAGGTLIFNRIFGVSSQQFAVNGGVGFEGHFPTSFGMLVPTAEWRVDVPFSHETVSGVRAICDGETATVSTIYSIPRLSIYWYPKF